MDDMKLYINCENINIKLKRKKNPLFLFAKMFLKNFLFPKSIFQNPNHKNKSSRCFNIYWISKNKSRKTHFVTVDSQK